MNPITRRVWKCRHPRSKSASGLKIVCNIQASLILVGGLGCYAIVAASNWLSTSSGGLLPMRCLPREEGNEEEITGVNSAVSVQQFRKVWSRRCCWLLGFSLVKNGFKMFLMQRYAVQNNPNPNKEVGGNWRAATNVNTPEVLKMIV